jgi:hypothetical protein
LKIGARREDIRKQTGKIKHGIYAERTADRERGNEKKNERQTYGTWKGRQRKGNRRVKTKSEQM